MLVYYVYSLLALSCAAAAHVAAPAGKRAGLLPRQIQECTDPGWIPVCPGEYTCIPAEGTCCTNGYYHLPGETCPDGESEVPRVDQPDTSVTISAPPSISSAPAPPVGGFTWYTYTIYYTYYTYYYYSIEESVTLTSSLISAESVVSLTATDDEAASSAVEALSATIAPPSQTATVTLDAPPDATESAVSSEATVVPTPSKTITSTQSVALPSVSQPPQFTGAAVGSRTVGSAFFGGSNVCALSALLVAPGLLMLLL